MRNTIFFKLKYSEVFQYIYNDYIIIKTNYFPIINLQYKHCSPVLVYIIKTVL